MVCVIFCKVNIVTIFTLQKMAVPLSDRYLSVDDLDLLQHIYARLDEFDGMTGKKTLGGKIE